MAVCCVHAPPGPVISEEEWSSYLDGMLPYSMIFLGGDFNAHHTSWGCSRSTPRGQALYETSLKHDLVSINDSLPTYVPGSGVSSSNIDLIFCPLSLFHLARVDVVVDPLALIIFSWCWHLSPRFRLFLSRRTASIRGRFLGLPSMNLLP